MAFTSAQFIEMFGEQDPDKEQALPVEPPVPDIPSEVPAPAPVDVAPDEAQAPAPVEPEEPDKVFTSEDFINKFGAVQPQAASQAPPPDTEPTTVTGTFAEWLAQEKEAAPDPKDNPGYYSNLVRKFAESFPHAAGEALATGNAIGKRINEELKTKEGSAWNDILSATQLLQGIASQRLKGADFGAVTLTTPEDIKAKFNEGDALGTAVKVAEFIPETLADSVAYMISLPLTTLSLTDMIAQENADNEGKKVPDFIDYVEAFPFALGSAIIELVTGRALIKPLLKSVGVIGKKNKKAIEKVGKDALRQGFAASLKKGAKLGGGEMTGEFIQEGVIEYIGGRYGTDKALDWKEGAERGGWAALAGAGYGFTLGTIGARADQRRAGEQEGDVVADELTGALDEVENEAGNIDQAQADAVDRAQEQGGDELDQALAGAQAAADIAAKDGDAAAAVEEASALQDRIAEDEKRTAAESAKGELEAAKTRKKQQAKKREDESVEEFRARVAAAGLEAGQTTAQPVPEPQAPIPEAPANPAMREALKKAESERIAKEKVTKAEEVKAEEVAAVAEKKRGEFPEDFIAQETKPSRREENRPGKDRREDTKQRKAINEMTLEEAQHELRTDSLTGLGSNRAWEETEKKPVIAAIDADSLKWFNDNMSFASGDKMLKEIGKAIAAETDQGFHPTGDEYFVQGDTQEEVDAIMARVEARLKDIKITATRPNGTVITKTGVSFSYGTAANEEAAIFAMKDEKANRQKAGDRVATGERPSGVNEVGFNAYREEEIKQEEKKKEEKLAKRKAKLAGKKDTPKTEKELAGEFRSEAEEAATSPTNNLKEPTEAQKTAGNYKKGHPELQGVKIAVENPVGSVRTGTDETGRSWKQKLKDAYGYVKGTLGADGDPVDTFVGTNVKSEKVFVVDQINQTSGEFDEHKVMLGYSNGLDARRAYSRNYEDGWKVGPITEMTMDQFKQWVNSDKAQRAIQLSKIQSDLKNKASGVTQKEIDDTIASQTGRGRRTTSVTNNSSRLEKAKTRIPVSTNEDVENTLGKPDKKPKPKTEKVEPKVSRQEVNSVADGIRAEMPSVGITVVTNVDELPSNLSQKVKDDKATGVKGFYDSETDQIYIISDNASSVEDAESTILHEVVGHKGLQAFLGDSFDTVMNEMYQSITDRKALNALAENKGIDTTTDAGKQLAAEEYAASIAEKDTGTPGIQRLISKMRAALRKMGVISEWTNADIKALLSEARAGMQRAPLSDFVVSYKAEVRETGEVVDIKDDVDVALRQIDKRRGVLEQLRGCLS